VHRRLSTCAYSPIEAVTSCAPPPPPERLAPIYYRDAPAHTARILQAIVRMTNTLTLPTNIAKHTPFAICMIAATTIVHLSACRFVLKGEQLGVARERIRVAMGALGTLAEVWPAGKRIVTEVKTVARELLNLSPIVTPVLSYNTGNPTSLPTQPEVIRSHEITEDSYSDIDYNYLDILSFPAAGNDLTGINPNTDIEFPFQAVGFT
jgi:hypothetical protein